MENLNIPSDRAHRVALDTIETVDKVNVRSLYSNLLLESHRKTIVFCDFLDCSLGYRKSDCSIR